MEIHGCLQGWAVTRLRAVGFLLWTPGVIIREVQGIQIRKKIKRKENEDTLTAYMIRASRNFIEPLKFTMLLRPRGRHVLRSLCVNSRGSAIHSHFPAVQVEKAFFAPPSSPGAGWGRRFSLHSAVATASSPRRLQKVSVLGCVNAVCSENKITIQLSQLLATRSFFFCFAFMFPRR